MPTLEDHPLAAIFPLMGEGDLAALAADIEANGLRDPVWLYEGKILDGRNRYRACLLKDIDHRVEQYRGRDPLGFIVSKNLRRRHLTESQRAAVAARIAGLGHGGDRRSDQAANLPLETPPVTQAKAAEMLNVSERSVRAAVAVQKDGVPELVKAVDTGKVSVGAAAEVAKLPKAEQKKAVAAGPGEVKAAARRRRTREKKADDAETPPVAVAPPTPVDAWGIPVQPHAAEAFVAVPRFKDLLAAIQVAQKLFNEAANLPGGKFLTLPDVSSYRRGKKQADGEYADRFVHEGLEQAYRHVKNAVPTHTVCPWHYVEAPHPADCRTCKQLNWTPPLGDSIPAAAVERAKAAFGVEG